MAVDARQRARELVSAAREDKRRSQHFRRSARQRLEEARAFCAKVGLDFEEIRTEATGHGPRENGDT